MKTHTLTGPLRFRGELSVPADKSITHRALILGAIAHGTTRILNPLNSADCKATASAVTALGASIHRKKNEWAVTAPEELVEPEGVLDVGNSGTSIRLLAGLVAAHELFVVLTGDASLCRRPMRRIVEPLRAMGADIDGPADASRPPLAIRGALLSGTEHELQVASAQVKSCLLLAGLRAEGDTSIREPAPSRDHTERMLQAVEVPITFEPGYVRVRGGAQIEAPTLQVPGDLSSAAFFLVAATLASDSRLVLPGVGVNPTRTGLLDVLERMGASIERTNEQDINGEPRADLVVSSTDSLQATTVSGAELVRLIDEVPILAVAAMAAEGTTRIEDAGELRVKESDRLGATCEMVKAFGGTAEIDGDALVIEGPTDWKPALVESGGDHRVAMAAAIAAGQAEGESEIRDVRCVDTSYPGFFDDLKSVTG